MCTSVCINFSYLTNFWDILCVCFCSRIVRSPLTDLFSVQNGLLKPVSQDSDSCNMESQSNVSSSSFFVCTIVGSQFLNCVRYPFLTGPNFFTSQHGRSLSCIWKCDIGSYSWVYQFFSNQNVQTCKTGRKSTTWNHQLVERAWFLLVSIVVACLVY